MNRDGREMKDCVTKIICKDEILPVSCSKYVAITTSSHSTEIARKPLIRTTDRLLAGDSPETSPWLQIKLTKTGNNLPKRKRPESFIQLLQFAFFTTIPIYTNLCSCVLSNSYPGFCGSPSVTMATKRKHMSSWLLVLTSLLLLCYCTAVEAAVFTVPLYHDNGIRGNNFEKVLHRGSRSTPDNATMALQQNNLQGKPGQGYFLEMQIGTPPQKLNVLVDTGSSNFAIAAAPHPDIQTFFNTSSSVTYQATSVPVDVPYTQGSWSGQLGRDLVTVTTLPNVSVVANIACIDHSSGFFINGSNWQGILGLAFSGIARPDSSVTPYFDLLVASGAVDDIFSMQLCGTVDLQDVGYTMMGGSMTFGGADPALYKGDIMWAPLYKNWYYEVILTEVSVNGKPLAMDCKEYNFDKTIVDSGTTNLRLPDRVFQAVVSHMRGITKLTNKIIPDAFWSGTDIVCWNTGTTPWRTFPSLDLTIVSANNMTFDLRISPEQYLRAVHDSMFGGIGEECYKFAISSSTAGTVLGAVVMEGYYVVFDRAARRVGFAVGMCSTSSPEAAAPRLTPLKYRENTGDCAYKKPVNDQQPLVIIAYVMAGICVLCLIPLVAMVIQWQWQRFCRRRPEPSDVSALLKEDDLSGR